MPNSLLHAYSLGVPCVATDCECGPSEIFSYPGISRLVPVNDSATLAQAVVELCAVDKVSDTDYSSEIAESYSLENVCNQYEHALRLRGTTDAI